MKKLFTTLLILFVKISFAQEVTAAVGLDTINTDKREVYNLWKNYLNASPDSLYNNPYWNAGEKLKYKSYDLLKSEGHINPSLYYFNLSKEVLSITRTDDFYLIRTSFYYIDKKISHTYAITNVVAKKVNGRYLLFNYLPYHTEKWHSQTNGLIKYHYYPSYHFDKSKADSANVFLRKICRAFSIKADSIDYYIAADCDGIFKLKGYDYVISMGSAEDCGYYDQFNGIVYASGMGGENHYHELTHVINKFYPKAHELLLSGISAYWSGNKAHRAKPLIYHIKRVDEYLLSHPNLDLSDLTGFYQLDDRTNPS